MEPCIQKWTNSLSEQTIHVSLPVLESFFEFASVKPGEAVRFQRENPLSYKFVDSAYKWLDQRELAVGTMRTRMGVLRGFFIANRVPLPRDKHRFRSSREKVVGELSVDDFRKILMSCNRIYRAAFLVQFQSGSGVGELDYINTRFAEHIRHEVKNGKQLIRLRMPGRKQNRNVKPYYTFIGLDAVDALRILFHSQSWRKDDVLFRNKRGDRVSKIGFATYFRSHAVKAGVIQQYAPKCLDCSGETVKDVERKRGVNGHHKTSYVCTVCQSRHSSTEYGMSHDVRGGIRYKAKTHELRDLFRTQCHYAQTYKGFDASAGEFFMGHTVDPLEYDKIMRDSAYAMSEYRKAMSFLNIISEEPLKVARTDVEEEFAGQRKELEVMRRELDKLSLVHKETKRMDELEKRIEPISKKMETVIEKLEKLEKREKL